MGSGRRERLFLHFLCDLRYVFQFIDPWSVQDARVEAFTDA